METTLKGIIILLKSAIIQKPLPLPEGFDIAQTVAVIRSHNLSSLACDGALCCGIPLQHPVMQPLFRTYCKAIQISQRQLQALNRLYAAFEENAIDYMPLKGSRMKYLYPKPELRLMGDADILIRTAQYEQIKPILISLGFEEKMETDHELVWQSDGLYLELHKRLIPSYNQDFYEYFGDGWNLASIKQGCCWSMTPEDEWIYLFTHFAKHFRDGGIGCRHVVDLWVYRRANRDLNEDYVAGELKKLQLLEFYENILRLLAVWFEDQMPDEKMEFMTEFIFSSGSWGQMESRVKSVMVRDTKHSPLGFSGKLTFFVENTFPPVELLWDKYKFLKKCPWLLPVVWVIRPFYKLLFERRSLMQKKSQMDAVTHNSLQKQQQMLNYVGLDYHF